MAAVAQDALDAIQSVKTTLREAAEAGCFSTTVAHREQMDSLPVDRAAAERDTGPERVAAAVAVSGLASAHSLAEPVPQVSSMSNGASCETVNNTLNKINFSNYIQMFN